MSLQIINYKHLLLYITLIPLFTFHVNAGEYLDLSKAKIIVKSKDDKTAEAANYLSGQIGLRSGIQMPITYSNADNGNPVINIGLMQDMEIPLLLTVPAKSESYAIWVNENSEGKQEINLCGRDGRGVLFAAGRLLQHLYLSENYISLPSDLLITSAPADELRAQQILNNIQSEDGFMDWDDAGDLENHVNELIIAGTNGIETTEPQLIDDYLEKLGIDLFIKLKCQEIIDLDTLEKDEDIINFYEDITGIDHITSYGGDASGAVAPQLFFPHMDRVIPLLLKGQPGARWWYSNQCLEDHAKDYDDYIFNYFRENQPSYLYGMVYGPWTKRGIPDIRKDLPSQYVIRHFPEICHPRWCQYPVPGWDRIFAIVWPRNHSIYMMPTMMRDIYLANRTHTVGSLPYNHTGTYNDLNKFVWSYVGWNPEATVKEILKVYARAFFVHDFIKHPEGKDKSKMSMEEFLDDAVDFVAKGFQLLEQNWATRLKDNTSAEEALKYWTTIAECTGGTANNWRVEMFLYKARIDAQIKRKYDVEVRLENEAYDILRQANDNNLQQSIDDAIKKLGEIEEQFQSKKAFLAELENLGLTDKFGDRDEIINNLYTSFNDRLWIEDQLETCRSAEDLKDILEYENAGTGGFYDNLGVPGEQPHLVGQYEWKTDPGFVHHPIEWVNPDDNSDQRHSMLTHALARYDTPLEMKWTNLDPNSEYRIKVVYNGPFDIRIKCLTDDGMVIHDFIEKPGEEILSFTIPQSSTADGSLKLRWFQDTTDIMRGVSVSEIWLTRKQSK